MSNPQGAAPDAHPVPEIHPPATHTPFDDPVEVHEENGRKVLRLGTGRNHERIVFFSDAVFAIAMTLLVLDIRLPEGTTADNLNEHVLELGPKLSAFGISFLVIAGTWITHFRRFRLMRGYNPSTIRQNTLLLLLVCLVPFPTSVFAEHAAPLSTAMYGGMIGLIFIVQAWSTHSAFRDGLLDPIFDASMNRKAVGDLLWVGLPFLAAVALAWVNLHLTYLLFLLPAARMVVLHTLRAMTSRKGLSR